MESTNFNANPQSTEEVPVINIQAYFDKSEGWEEECKKVADCLHNFGILVIRDPRVNHQDNETYIDMMEKYFEEQGKKFYAGEELEDARPELSYQTGVTPESVERARDHAKICEDLPAENQPLSRFPPEFDAKWRFFWPIGERPKEVQNDIPKIYPKNFPDWEQKMDKWGYMMIDACKTSAEMAAIGMGLEKDTFADRMDKGHHLLAPTGSDLKKYDVGTPFAGFHYDLNFLTIHGKSRYPGLFVWLRNWKRMAAKIPEGCLLLQAGSMFEHITGGYVLAGYHEVFYTENTKAVLQKTEQQIAEGKERVCWRVSSTLFSQLRYDVDLSPLPELKDKIPAEAYTKYVKMTAHDKLCEELKAINLAPKQSYADKENPEVEQTV